MSDQPTILKAFDDNRILEAVFSLGHICGQYEAFKSQTGPTPPPKKKEVSDALNFIAMQINQMKMTGEI